jgi:hypothetical protein
MQRAARDLNAGSRGGNFVPSSIHDRKSFSDQNNGFGFFGGFW